MRRWWGRLGLRWRRAAKRPAFWTAVLTLVLLLGAAASFARGAVPVASSELFAALVDPGHPAHPIVALIRLPRVLSAVVVGASLAVAGLLMQTVVRNPLADAGVLGVSSGAGLAAMFVLVLKPEWAVALPVFAFTGAALAVLLVLSLSALARGGVQPLRLLLSGVALQAVLFAAVAILSYLYADRAPAFVAFSVGSLAGATWREVALGAPTLGLGLGAALLARRPLDLLLLDDASAAGVGLAVGRARVLASGIAALLAATAVALAGLVGFVGLVAPNALRLAIGPDHRALVPLSALAGGVLVLLADLLARTVAAPVELPVGALLALVGGPMFLYLLVRRLP